MKNKFRNLSAVVLTTIYCLAISMIVESHIDSQIQHHSKLEKGGFASVVSSSIYFCNTTTTENTITILSKDLIPSFKNQTNDGHTAAININNHLVRSQFTQYQSGSINFIQHRKSDKLFPFQYFW